ncbi:hypothetical protein EV138_2515 [Kribbella voronezhensis]|uniref:Uncharacterized protein n=1 Tax=Kribbella voronezhensis TaxID=2512212 RepID=A0A4R7TAB7_9ACTN|nr:hypothetical protein [Kribbella voronezhensis]TDU88962.1 hypothetical protein EV138_2515 [Kribbella voronezhensis]
MAQESGDLLTTVGRAGALFGRAWPRLFAVFLIAQLVHRGVQWVAVQAGAKAEAAGIAVLALVVLVSLAMYVSMFLVLRGELPFHRRAVAEGVLAPDGMEPGKEHRPLDAIASALLPFLAFYAAYKFLQSEAMDYEYSLAVHRVNEIGATVMNGGTVAAQPTGLHALSTWLFIGLGVTAYLLRLVFKKRKGTDGGPVRKLFVTYLEALWIFVVAYQATSFIPSPKTWLKERQVWLWVHDSYIWVLDHVLGVEKVREVWDSVTGFLAAGIGDLWSAAVLPLMWITMTAVIYGRAVHKAEKPQQVRWRFDRITHRWQRTPQIVRAAGNSMVSDWKDRWTPVISAFRLVARSGIRPMLGYFLAWAVVTYLAGEVGIILRDYVLGPHSLEFWKVIDEPLSLVTDGLKIALQISLLAAAYDRMIGGLAGYLRPRTRAVVPSPDDNSVTDLTAATSGMPDSEAVT